MKQELTTDNLVAFVKKKCGGVTFVEIKGQFEDTEGDFYTQLRPNIVPWYGMSETLIACITEAVQSDLIHMKPCSPFVYAFDGEGLRFPIAKKLPKTGYKKLHWLPVVFNPGGEK